MDPASTADVNATDAAVAAIAAAAAGDDLRQFPKPPAQQPPPPIEQSFASLEDAKEYLSKYSAESNTKLVIFRSNKARGITNYRCVLGGLYVNKRLLNLNTRRRKTTSEKINCGFKLQIKLDKFTGTYDLKIGYPFHSHSVSPYSSNDVGYRRPTEVIEAIYELVETHHFTDLARVKLLLQLKFPKLELSDKQIQAEIDTCTARYPEAHTAKSVNVDQAIDERQFRLVTRFVYKLLAHTTIDDVGSIRFLLADKFKDMDITDQDIAGEIEFCKALKQKADVAEKKTEIDPIDPEITEAETASKNEEFNNKIISQAIALSSLGDQLLESLDVGPYEQHLPQAAPPTQRAFQTMDDAKEYLKEYMKQTKIGLVVYKSGKNRGYCLYRCERGGKPEENLVKRPSAVKNEPELKKKRNRVSKKINCPFRCHVKYDKKSKLYHLSVPTPVHNHSVFINDLRDHPILRKRNPEHIKYLSELYLGGITKPQFLKRRLVERFPDLNIIDKDIYNDIRRIKQKIRQELTLQLDQPFMRKQISNDPGSLQDIHLNIDSRFTNVG